MKLLCPKCGSPIPGTDLDIAGRVGVCRPCGEIVPFPSQAIEVSTGRALATRYKPDSLRWVELSTGPRFEAVVPPKRVAAIPLLGFAAVWDGVLFTWYYAAFSSPHGTPLASLLFPILHVGAGVFVTYMALKTLLNTIRVTVDGGTFQLTSTPIPSRGNLTLPVSEIDGFRVVDKSTSKTTRFGVVADAGRTAQSLSLGVGERIEAEFVAARLNEVLEDAKHGGRGEDYRS